MTLQEIVNDYLTHKKIIRLHLGCGPNLLQNYINIEGESYPAQENLYLHNLTEQYPIPNNCVDEILSVHVIEHLNPSVVPFVLSEWLRILKPGKFVAVEWPDLLKMCKFIVDDPSRIYSENKKIQKRSVAGIFGNISKHKSVDMLHKWGYSVDSLSRLFESTGFSLINVENPIFPKTEMDSRIVAYK